MTTYIYQISENQDEAEMMGGATSLIIADKEVFAETGALNDDHILDDMVQDIGDQTLYDHLDEVAESMFVSDLPADELRAFLADVGGFEEALLFGED